MLPTYQTPTAPNPQGAQGTPAQTQQPPGYVYRQQMDPKLLQTLGETVVAKKTLVDDYFRDMRLVVILEKRVYSALVPREPSGGRSGDRFGAKSSSKTSDLPEFIYILEITKSRFSPQNNQKATEDMLTRTGAAVSVLWANYRARSEGESIMWRETLRYEGGPMVDTELLSSAYNDIKNKRQIVDNVFDTFSAF